MKLLVILLAGCAIAASTAPGIDVDRVVAHVHALVALGPRPHDTPASAHAADYIARELTAMGLNVDHVHVGDVALPAIDVLGMHARDATTAHTDDADLVVHFGPPGRALLIMAHYDTVPTSPGAVDNAAAVGVSLELARVLVAHPPLQPVMIAFTADEESGLVGAEALAAQRGDDVELAIALDLVGASGELSINGASELIGVAELRWLARAADRAGVIVRAPLPHRVVSRWWPQAERADHGAFTRRGIRAIHLYDRGQGGEWIDLAYHSRYDVASRVDLAAVAELGRYLRALVEERPPAHTGDGFWLPVAHGVVVPRWLLVAFELVLAALAIAALFVLARESRVLPPERGAGIVLGMVAFAIAAAATYALERGTARGHPMPWIHDPTRALVCEGLVLAGALGLVTRAIARVWPWAGSRRYLALAIAWSLAIGIALVVVDAPELAWIWLVPAAALAVAPRVKWFALAAVLPAVLVLAPNQLREAAWNGFLPATIPLAAWITAVAISPIAAFAWWSRSRRASVLGTLVLAVGCALAVAIGATGLVVAEPRCSALDFSRLQLGCERSAMWP
ncbi:MAG TPA: M28 family metallopeptidase [Kofleriaceae bacterium]|nr:M28 family metallopeptidase [Kofleriaceae bacterium]